MSLFFLYIKLSLVTLKLFDTLLQKDDDHIIHNLVLRNLLGRTYISPHPATAQAADNQGKEDNSSNRSSDGKEGEQELLPFYIYHIMLGNCVKHFFKNFYIHYQQWNTANTTKLEYQIWK